MNGAAMLTQSADSSRLRLPLSDPEEEPVDSSSEMELVGRSAVMKRLRMQVQRIAPHFRSVLVRGERGTGKELVARILHATCGRVGEPLLLQDAAAVVEGCIRAEVPVSRFAEGAQRGTLFLDRVDGLSLPAQDLLLQVLGWKESAPGLRRNLSRIEMKVIASTTDDLRPLVAAGRFRQDLYQRLATVEIVVPALRERMEDLPELAGYFVDRFRRFYSRSVHGIAPEAMQRLQKHQWLGNVRELGGVIQDAVLRSHGELLEVEHLALLKLPCEGEGLATNAGASVRLQDVVERHVLDVLKGCDGNKLRAAEMLGISRSTLYRMLETGSSAAALR
jgi:DNA-binding NtrC family response regulator